VVDRSGSAILEEILRNDFRKPPVLGSLGLKETGCGSMVYLVAKETVLQG
jgi:hypothetical protein